MEKAGNKRAGTNRVEAPSGRRGWEILRCLRQRPASHHEGIGGKSREQACRDEPYRGAKLAEVHIMKDWRKKQGTSV